MTREDADQFLAMVESISTIAGADGEILSIVQEETPAYFKGLKSAEDVAKIIQDRVKTLVNERA
jgi:multiple sugar transport system substrate-binding protein